MQGRIRVAPALDGLERAASCRWHMSRISGTASVVARRSVACRIRLCAELRRGDTETRQAPGSHQTLEVPAFGAVGEAARGFTKIPGESQFDRFSSRLRPPTYHSSPALP